ncbi:hypothetical protein E4U44_008710 [Claviceps purpurea]|nr:hypothetical protein E4U44_008710 [Claviceps purpurea]
MKISAPTLMLAAALGASARPSGHGHGHGQLHRSLEKRIDFVMNEKPTPPVVVKPVAPVKNAYQAPPPPPPTPVAPVSTPVQTKPASNPGSSSSGPKKFCGGLGKRATLAQIAYEGNVGAASNYGCNLMAVDDASGYDYSASFENTSGKDQKCVAWLKIGPTGKIDGFFKGNEALTFDLPANGKKYLVADSDTQGGVACSPSSIQYSNIGQFAGTWFEFDFANHSNGGYSGADISSLVAASAGLPIQAMKVCAAGNQPCSVINNGGSGTNAYVAGTNDLDGVGLNMNPGPVHFEVTVG